MMHVLPCDRVRENLAAYHDDELPMEERVLIQGHLAECVACRLEASALADLGDALRTMAVSVPGRASSDAGQIAAAVLERVHVERQFSLGARFSGLFEDMHLVWAGLGASFAMSFCIFASAGVLQAASRERPDSLAGIISTIVHADASQPMRLAPTVVENRTLLDTTAAMQATGGDAELMLSALITREGRIQNLEVLEEQARVLRVKPEVVLAMVEAASRARFERGHTGQAPMNVVWLVTTTTVKGRPDYDLYLVNPPRWSADPPHVPPPPRKAPRVPKTPTAGDDGLSNDFQGPTAA